MAKAFKFGNDLDTDAIIPAAYLVTTDPAELGAHAMEGSDQPDFAAQVAQGDVIVGGDNFGCGSSREHAPVALAGAGVSCVIARNFARIFFRNAVNIGLPVLECPAAADAIQAGHEVAVDLATGAIRDTTTGQSFLAEPMPEFMRAIFDAGGLVPFAQRLLAQR